MIEEGREVYLPTHTIEVLAGAFQNLMRSSWKVGACIICRAGSNVLKKRVMSLSISDFGGR